VLKDAFYGFSHFALAVALTALMVLMVVMFVIDIKTKYEKNRKRSKVTDELLAVRPLVTRKKSVGNLCGI